MSVPSMRLALGTLDVPDPALLLREYLDPRQGYAIDYDRLVTNGSPALVDGDLLAPTLLQSTVDAARFRVLREMLPGLARVAELPAVPLQAADDAVVDAVAALFGVLDDDMYRRRGVRGTILAKVLHRKRPDLVPLYDSRIFEAYTVPGAVDRVRDRSWVDFMVELCRAMRADLVAEADAFATLERVAADAGTPLTRLRILDILVWRTAGDWH